MKKVLLLLTILLSLPIIVNAEKLTKTINIPIKGIGNLNLDGTVHNINVKSKSNILSIIVETNDENAIVEGDGQVEMQEGDNSFIVKVSNDTTSEEYTINVNYTKIESSIIINENTEDERSNPTTGTSLNIIGLSIAIIAGIFILKKSTKKMFI